MHVCKYVAFNPETFVSVLQCKLAFVGVFHIGHSCENKFAFKLGSHAGLLQLGGLAGFSGRATARLQEELHVRGESCGAATLNMVETNYL